MGRFNFSNTALLTVLPLSLLLIALLFNSVAVYAKPDNGSGSTIEISNGILTVYVENETGFGIGSYTICTGPNHPAPDKNVFYGGSVGSAWSSYNTIVVNETKRMYVTTSYKEIIPDPNYTVICLDENLTSIHHTNRIVVIKWRTDENLFITQEIEILGSTIHDTYVRVTVSIKNEGSQKYTVGIRYLWDIMIADNDGSWLRTVNPSSNWLSSETDWLPPDFSYWEATDNPNNPTFTIYGSISEPSWLRIPATPPKGFMFAAWGGGSNPNPGLYDYAYSFSHLARTIADSNLDSAVAYYWEKKIDVGENWSVTAYLCTSPPLPPPVGGFIIDSDLSITNHSWTLHINSLAILTLLLSATILTIVSYKSKFRKRKQ